MALSGTRLAGVTLVTQDVDGLAAFYAAAFGFSRTGDVAGSDERRLTLQLGGERLDLLGFAVRGAPYPADVPGWDPTFQHIAIVVDDMTAAMARLSGLPGWRAISVAGPQILPASSGGVSAFKFRDPEGHPLELLAFPPESSATWSGRRRVDGNPCLGYDHSAISVRDTEASIAFYGELGLQPDARMLNHGIEQAKLDDIVDPRVEVTALMPEGRHAPHVELLCYLGAYPRVRRAIRPNDVAATRLRFTWTAEADAPDFPLRDPDGHWIERQVFTTP